MRAVFDALPLSMRLITRDPINLMLALLPTLLAIVIYCLAVIAVLNNSDALGSVVQNYIPDPQTAGWVGKLLTVIFVIFIFLIMSWTFVVVVGILAAPFNSMLSARIEKRLTGKALEMDKQKTLSEVMKNLGVTFWNEIKKLIFIVALTMFALLLNLFPLFYPVGFFLLSLLLAAQFVDYSWSRHELTFGACVKDLSKNVFPYAGSGFLFLLLVTVPIINAFVPALATSYYTVLWLHRQNKIQMNSVPQVVTKSE